MTEPTKQHTTILVGSKATLVTMSSNGSARACLSAPKSTFPGADGTRGPERGPSGPFEDVVATDKGDSKPEHLVDYNMLTERVPRTRGKEKKISHKVQQLIAHSVSPFTAMLRKKKRNSVHIEDLDVFEGSPSVGSGGNRSMSTTIGSTCSSLSSRASSFDGSPSPSLRMNAWGSKKGSISPMMTETKAGAADRLHSSPITMSLSRHPPRRPSSRAAEDAAASLFAITKSHLVTSDGFTVTTLSPSKES